MDKQVRILLISMRHWSSLALKNKGTDQQNNFQSLARAIETSLQEDLWKETEVLWRVLLGERFPFKARLYSLMGEDELRGAINNLYLIVDAAGDVRTDELMRRQALSICRNINNTTRRALDAQAVEKAKEHLETYLGRPRFELIISR